MLECRQILEGVEPTGSSPAQTCDGADLQNQQPQGYSGEKSGATAMRWVRRARNLDLRPVRPKLALHFGRYFSGSTRTDSACSRWRGSRLFFTGKTRPVQASFQGATGHDSCRTRVATHRRSGPGAGDAPTRRPTRLLRCSPMPLRRVPGTVSIEPAARRLRLDGSVEMTPQLLLLVCSGGSVPELNGRATSYVAERRRHRLVEGLRAEASIEGHDGGAHETQRMGHAGMPGGGATHLRAVIRNKYAIEPIFVED